MSDNHHKKGEIRQKKKLRLKAYTIYDISSQME